MPDGIPLSEWSGSGATRELLETIERFNVETAKQTRQLLILTWVIAVLTAVMVIGLFVQIYLAWRALPGG
jgi:hypothetical protein